MSAQSDASTSRSKLHGLRIPRGISKLRSLHTLRVVNVARGKAATFEELRGLTQLRKLGVVGVDHTNMEMFWRSIAGHSRLQSLSVDHYKLQNVGATLDQCLGKDLSPPRCLESLKMHCKLVKVPEWIHRLPNLFKLQLEEAMFNQDAIEIIGTLPNLAVLRLHTDSFLEKHLRLRRSSFQTLLLLELHELLFLRSVGFEEDAVPRLEVLQARSCSRVKEFSGLRFLTRLKEIQMDDDKLKEMVQSQLAEHTTMKLLPMLRPL